MPGKNHVQARALLEVPSRDGDAALDETFNRGYFASPDTSESVMSWRERSLMFCLKRAQAASSAHEQHSGIRGVPIYQVAFCGACIE
jgi:hypothetical protein